MPKTQVIIKEMYHDLMKISRATFEAREYDVAYHSLMEAMYCTNSLEDIQYLTEVANLAGEELAYIDAHYPEYKHSTRSAARRDRLSIFELAVQQARAKILIIKPGFADRPR